MARPANRLWVMSDTHFGHKKIIAMCGRPENHEELMFKSLSEIPENDVLIHLGDICMGKDSDHHDKYIEPLKCRKWLVRGNHDPKSISWYLSHGWDFVADSITLRLFGWGIVLTHVPTPQDDPGVVNVHGHLHNTGHRGKSPEGCILYSPELEGYKPVLLQKLVPDKPKEDV